MIKWPNRAKSAIRKLFEPLQDIDVYVEDDGDEAFYRSLFRFATNNEINISRVFSLGGRGNVLASAQVHDHKVRRALFVVDGDLHWVKDRSLAVGRAVHCHAAYCVENLLLCELALTTLVAQENAIVERDAAAQLQYSNWKIKVQQPLVELFAAFAVAHDLAPSIPTVSRGIGAVISAHPQTKIAALDLNKVVQLKQDIIDAVALLVERKKVEQRYQDILQSIATLKDPIAAISGKDFLLPLIGFHLNSLGCRVSRKSLRIRLASAGDARRFDGLAQALKAAAAGDFAH